MERNFAELLLVVLLDRARLATVRVRLPSDCGTTAIPTAVPADAVMTLLGPDGRDPADG